MNTDQQPDKSKQPSACILCSRNCGINITVEAGRFTEIKGDPAHPMTQGYLCQKAARLAYYQDHMTASLNPSSAPMRASTNR